MTLSEHIELKRAVADGLNKHTHLGWHMAVAAAIVDDLAAAGLLATPAPEAAREFDCGTCGADTPVQCLSPGNCTPAPTPPTVAPSDLPVATGDAASEGGIAAALVHHGHPAPKRVTVDGRRVYPAPVHPGDTDAGDEGVRLGEDEREALHPPTICDCDDHDHCPTLTSVYVAVERILSARLTGAQHVVDQALGVAAVRTDQRDRLRDELLPAVHARWHRALDDPTTEPDGPIKDHLLQHNRRLQAEALRAAAADMESGEHRCFRPQGCVECGRQKEREGRAHWLRARADRIEAGQ